MDVVSRKILLRKRMYVFGSTGVSKQRNNENLGQNEKKTIVYEPKRFLNDGPVKKSAVWSKFRCLVVSSFCRFVVLRSRQKSQINFKCLNFKRARRRLRQSPWQLDQPNLSLRLRPGTSVKYLEDGSRDTEKAFWAKSSTNKNARFVGVVQKIRG